MLYVMHKYDICEKKMNLTHLANAGVAYSEYITPYSSINIVYWTSLAVTTTTSHKSHLHFLIITLPDVEPLLLNYSGVG